MNTFTNLCYEVPAMYPTAGASETAAWCASCINDIFALLKLASSAAANDDDAVAAEYLKRSFALARYSSDFIDTAKILRQYPRLQDYIPLNKCLQKAKKAARIPGDFAEIDLFIKENITHK